MSISDWKIFQDICKSCSGEVNVVENEIYKATTEYASDLIGSAVIVTAPWKFTLNNVWTELKDKQIKADVVEGFLPVLDTLVKTNNDKIDEVILAIVDFVFAEGSRIVEENWERKVYFTNISSERDNYIYTPI